MKNLILTVLWLVSANHAVAAEGVNPERALLAYMKVLPNTQSQFLNAAKNVIIESRKEAGNITYILQQSVDDPEQFVFYELYKTDADLELHRNSKHVVDFLNEVNPIVVPGQFILVKYENVNSNEKKEILK